MSDASKVGVGDEAGDNDDDDDDADAAQLSVIAATLRSLSHSIEHLRTHYNIATSA